MVKNCSAPNCKNRADKSFKRGLTFHLFPRNARKRQNWLKEMRDSSSASWEPSAYSVICSEHFEDSSFRYLNGKRLVKDDAFPTKFLLPKEKTEIAQVSPGLPIKMTFIPTETDVFIDNLTKVDRELNNSIELSETDQTTNDKQDHLNQIVSAYEQDLVITEEQSSQVDLEKSDDLAVNIMFEVANFPESSEQMVYQTEEANLSREFISQFIEEVHLEIASDLTGHIEASYQPPSQVPLPLPLLPSLHPSLPKNRTNLECNETNKNKTITSEQKDSQSPKSHEKVKTAKDYRGPSKKAKLAITLFRKAMRLSGLGLDVFLVVQELTHCTTYWGTKHFAKKFMLSKPLVDFKKTKCYDAEELYNFSNEEESDRPFVDDKKTMQKHPDPLLDSADHTYSLSDNNIKDGHWKASVADQTMAHPAKDPTLHNDPLPSSDPNGSSLVMDQRNIVQRSEKNCLSDKIDQLIAQNEEICFTSSVLSACKANKEAKIFRLPSVKYDSSATNSYNSKDNSMNVFGIGQEYLVQQSNKRRNPELLKRSKNSEHDGIK